MYELKQHTADVRLHVRAATVEELFAEAVRGLFATLAFTAAAGAHPVRRHLILDSVDRTALLVDFLGEVLVRAHIGREAFTDVTFERLTETEIAAELTGIAPASFERDVKAVTYHEAEVRKAGGEWETTLVLDI